MWWYYFYYILLLLLVVCSVDFVVITHLLCVLCSIYKAYTAKHINVYKLATCYFSCATFLWYLMLFLLLLLFSICYHKLLYFFLLVSIFRWFCYLRYILCLILIHFVPFKGLFVENMYVISMKNIYPGCRLLD